MVDGEPTDFDNDAKASTLRTRLSLQSGELKGFDVFLEFDAISYIGITDFNAGAGNDPVRPDYPTVADPKGAEVNQGYLDYNGFDGWLLRGGRQRINYDNQRFIGSVGWRQNEQTFDAFRVDYGTGKFKASYDIVKYVRRILGPRVSAGRDEMDATQFVNLSYDFSFGKLAGYYYYIDNIDREATSNQTLGARLSGKWKVNDSWGLRYEAELATQSDISRNPTSYDAGYLHLVGAAVIGPWDLGLGWEMLGGDEDVSGEAFRTPLATLHKFNGWADRFLTTPGAGIDDKYVGGKWAQGKWSAQVWYHDFRAEDGNDRYGTEIDAALGYKFTDRFSGLLKVADFSTKDDDSFPDTMKFWVMLSLNL